MVLVSRLASASIMPATATPISTTVQIRTEPVKHSQVRVLRR
jgi:hypothetical protein